MKEFKWMSFDGTERDIILWDDVPEKKQKGVVQIIHGMAEHALRYAEFAAFLNENGYFAAAMELRGHKGAAVLGHENGDVFFDTVKDNLAFTAYLAAKYDLPVSVVGHSYGSMITQAYIQNSPAIECVVLSGSAARTDVLAKIGMYVAKFQKTVIGGKRTAKLINKLSFGSFDKPFKDENRTFAWLSRDKENGQRYIDDPLCGYPMSINFQVSFMTALDTLTDDENVQKINPELPIMIASGEKDPVGGNGKFVEQLYAVYLRNGLKRIKFKLYKDARHEILNETNRREVYADILSFLDRDQRKNALRGADDSERGGKGAKS
ncbi:MAG: alpha/beta hydrolase [Clostridiales bacterium]|jgi:alpha-beta hydrolase superfamily lysophospholipase|nr:alpha/beta hydrolase [Clostridiales bacterium]